MYGRWKGCVRLRHHEEKLSHTHFILHQRIEKRPYCMWLCIPEGKPIWQVKSLQRGSQYQSNGRNKTIQTRVKDMAESNLIGRATLIGRILKLEKGLLKISLNLAVILYILWWGWGRFLAISESHKQEQVENTILLMPQHHNVYIQN